MDWVTMDLGILIGFILLVVVVAILGASAWYLGGSKPLNFILLVFGGTAGWIAGILLTPSGPDEEGTFTKVGTALVALITGYLGAHIEQAYQKHIQSGSLSEHFVGKSALTATAFLLGGLATFIWRQYGVSGAV